MIGKFEITAFCSLLSVIGSAHAIQKEGEVDPDWERYIRLGAIEDRHDWFEGLQGALHEDNQVYDEEHRKATFILHPTFDDIWLIAVETYPDVKVRRSETLTVGLRAVTEIRVSRMNWSSITEGQGIDPWVDRARHRRLTKDFYARPISKTEFDEIFELISLNIGGEPVIADEEHGCTDGTTFFAEALTNNEKKLVSRHNCDEDYESVLRKLHPFFEVAWAKIPYVQAELRDIWISETRETNTLK